MLIAVWRKLGFTAALVRLAYGGGGGGGGICSLPGATAVHAAMRLRMLLPVDCTAPGGDEEAMIPLAATLLSVG